MAENLNIPRKDLDARLIQLGELLGLLSDNGADSVTFHGDWFGDVGAQIKQIPNRPRDLLPLIRDFLGTAL